MQTERKKKDLWPLIVGTIAAIGIIGSNSTGGITKTTREPSPTPGISAAASPAANASAAPAASASAPVSAASAPDGSTGVEQKPGSGALRLVDATAAVKTGEEAFVAILGKPGTAYDIVVAFGSSTGGVSGMEQKKAGADGQVAWRWRVPALSSKGIYTITISGGGESLTTRLTVNG